MSKTAAKVRTTVVRVELPDEAFGERPQSARRIARDMRVLWLLDQVRQRHLGHGKAAELAGMPLAAFLDLMGQYHISSFDYNEEDLRSELRM